MSSNRPFTIRLPDDVREKIRARAEELGMSDTELCLRMFDLSGQLTLEPAPLPNAYEQRLAKHVDAFADILADFAHGRAPMRGSTIPRLRQLSKDIREQKAT